MFAAGPDGLTGQATSCIIDVGMSASQRRKITTRHPASWDLEFLAQPRSVCNEADFWRWVNVFT